MRRTLGFTKPLHRCLCLGGNKITIAYSLHDNNLGYTVIALPVLHKSISPTDQSIDFPSSHLIVGFPTHWRRFNRWSFKPSLIFTKCIRTLSPVNTFLNFLHSNQLNANHCLTNLPQTQRTSTQKTKNRHLFLSDGRYCLICLLLHLHNITVNTFTIIYCKCIPTLNMCILNSHYNHIYTEKIKNTKLFNCFSLFSPY